MIEGVPSFTEVQYRLGQATLTITLQAYSHFFKHVEGGTADENGQRDPKW